MRKVNRTLAGQHHELGVCSHGGLDTLFDAFLVVLKAQIKKQIFMEESGKTRLLNTREKSGSMKSITTLIIREMGLQRTLEGIIKKTKVTIAPGNFSYNCKSFLIAVCGSNSRWYFKFIRDVAVTCVGSIRGATEAILWEPATLQQPWGGAKHKKRSGFKQISNKDGVLFGLTNFSCNKANQYGTTLLYTCQERCIEELTFAKNYVVSQLFEDEGCETPAEVTDDSKWDEMDGNAIANLHLTLADGVLSSIEEKKSAKEIWDHLARLYKARSLHNKKFLKRKLYALRMTESTSVTEHVNNLNTLFSQLASLSFFDDVAAAILEEENRRNNREDRQTSSRQVEALVVTRGRSMEPGSSGSHNHGKSKTGKKKNFKCFKCCKLGHFRKDCRGLNTSYPQGNVASTSEDGNGVVKQRLQMKEGRDLQMYGCSIRELLSI
ncbi:gag-pol polyprotein [Tanacetum coccineum]